MTHNKQVNEALISICNNDSQSQTFSVITLPVAAVARCCDEYVCLCVLCLSVCLSVRGDISGTIRGIFTKFFVHVAYVHGSVLLWHVDNRLHCLSVGRE